MNRRSSSKISLFLMELIIAILFFSLASAVCVRLFTSAHTLSVDSINLSNSVTWSQNLAEAFYGCKGRLKDMEKLYPQAFISTDDDDKNRSTVILFFNEEWDLNEEGLVDAAFEAILETDRMSAKEAYADVNSYGVDLMGDAISGRVAVIDLRGTTEVFSSIPNDNSRTIFTMPVDIYVGKEDQ